NLAQVVEGVHDDRERVAQLVRDAGRQLPDRRHLLGLDQLPLEALPVRHVDVHELVPVTVAVVDEAGADEDRHQLARARAQMEVVRGRGALRLCAAQQRFRACLLGGGVEVGDRTTLEGGAVVAEQVLCGGVGREDAPVGGIRHEDAGGRVIERAAVAGPLLGGGGFPGPPQEGGGGGGAGGGRPLEGGEERGGG